MGLRACRGGLGGKWSSPEGLRYKTSLKMKREEKGWRVDGKAARDYSFTTLPEGVGLADGGRADAIPNAADGEGSHGAARPEGVIDRLQS
jgi:hypothetical protein